MRQKKEAVAVRPTRDEVLMETAKIWRHRGTCNRLRVGVVFSRDGRILVQGYNGAPSGMGHCAHVEDEPCTRAVHAEANGITWAARNGVALIGCEVHITNLPCPNCALLMINAGIARVVYDEDYRLHEGLSLLREASIRIEQYGKIIQ